MPDIGGIFGNIVDRITGGGDKEEEAPKPPALDIPFYIRPFLPEWFTNLPVEKQIMYYQMLLTAYELLQSSGAMGAAGHSAAMPGQENVQGFRAPANPEGSGDHMSRSSRSHEMPAELGDHGVDPEMWKELAMKVGTEVQKAQNMRAQI